jgi:hypothetical protein
MKKLTFLALLLTFSQIVFANSPQQKIAKHFILSEKYKLDKSYNLMKFEGNRIFLTNSSSSIKVSGKKKFEVLGYIFILQNDGCYHLYAMTTAVSFSSGGMATYGIQFTEITSSDNYAGSTSNCMTAEVWENFC